jgi:hypothetical protein
MDKTHSLGDGATVVQRLSGYVVEIAGRRAARWEAAVVERDRNADAAQDGQSRRNTWRDQNGVASMPRDNRLLRPDDVTEMISQTSFALEPFCAHMCRVTNRDQDFRKDGSKQVYPRTE